VPAGLGELLADSRSAHPQLDRPAAAGVVVPVMVRAKHLPESLCAQSMEVKP